MSKRGSLRAAVAVGAVALAAACGDEPVTTRVGGAAPAEGRVVAVTDTMVTTSIPAAGVAEPIRRATLSTRLMGSVTDVLVQEGARVRSGQTLARIDARDVAAQEARASAGVAEATAVVADAETQAGRIRSLYADSAASRAQLDAAETGLLRARAGLRNAEASVREVAAVATYATVQAPFAGVVVRRFVDPGAFVAPGAPIVTVEDGSRLRISVSVSPAAAVPLAPGRPVEASIEGVPVTATVEGVVPAAAGALYTVNAIVENADARFPPGAAAMLRLPAGDRRVILVPAGALLREGDLTGVRVVTADGAELRWVRTGDTAGGTVEVLSGLRPGERVLVPDPADGSD